MTWSQILINQPLPWVITFICSGNIMRSPFSEFIARKWFENNHPELKDKIVFRSGACVYKNSKIHPETIKWLQNEGFQDSEILTHIPRHFEDHSTWFSTSHLLITMTKEHSLILKTQYPKQTFSLSYVAIQKENDVLDPYFNQVKTKEIIDQLKSWVISFCNQIAILDQNE